MQAQTVGIALCVKFQPVRSAQIAELQKSPLMIWQHSFENVRLRSLLPSVVLLTTGVRGARPRSRIDCIWIGRRVFGGASISFEGIRGWQYVGRRSLPGLVEKNS